MAAPAISVERELRQLEKQYWDATLAGDAASLRRLTSDTFTFVMPEGINDFNRDDFVNMMTEGDFKLTSYQFDPDKARVRELGESAAFVTYHVKWTYRRAGKDEATDTYYTSIWAKEGRDWRMAAACESPRPKS